MALRVGVRALKAQLSHYLQLVRSGQEIEVTDRGVPVARIAPVDGAAAVLRELVAGGQVAWDGGKPRGVPDDGFRVAGLSTGQVVLQDRG